MTMTKTNSNPFMMQRMLHTAIKSLSKERKRLCAEALFYLVADARSLSIDDFTKKYLLDHRDEAL